MRTRVSNTCQQRAATTLVWMVVRACVSVHVREHVRVQACEAGSWCVEPLVRALSASYSSSSSSSSLLLLLLLL